MFKRKQKPKKLNLRQVHSLYLLLRHALPEEEERYLINEVEYILEHSKQGTLRKAVEILYGKVPENLNGLMALDLFTKGIIENNFFEYVHFVRNLNGR